MRRIPATDAGFLLAEKREAPQHVGGINLFSLPRGVNEREYFAELKEILYNARDFRKPFGEIAVPGRLPGQMYWEEDKDLDLDYHIRHSALPKPGRYRELFALVSRLHATLLDRTRPLWEIHLIEGLENRQFAIYQKLHHAAIDGVGAMHMTRAMCSTDPNAKAFDSPLSLSMFERYRDATGLGTPKKPVAPTDQELRSVSELFRSQFDTTANVLGALKSFGGALFGVGNSELTVPWRNVPHTSINTKVSGSRRFVAQSWPIARVKAVSKAVNGTLNDVVLAMCSGAFRRYLIDQNELPKLPLKAMVPVSLRSESDIESANAVGFITADLATNIRSPERRLRVIQESVQAGKKFINSMSQREAEIFLQFVQVPTVLTTVLGMAARFPSFSTVISNVPGPREQLYWHGAALQGMYPASIVFDGFAMNVTLVGYNQNLDFGIIACRRSVPHVQRMIDYLEDALQELEEMAGLKASPGKSRATGGAKRKTKATPKAKARVKSKSRAPTKSKAGSGRKK
ncbi:wax ester/triacylglycerol synthase family O-acyltransferase [Seongchinamella sediminis]|uniref:diacylglycerol O-acyltransferase n=1 Tax=Seongchinamella sediminis TaxID=2283635 RepID=A0A3L7DYT5_9GAMM|nr:wax ester/triacylglycerol synthase family O-acyltransferase [Seongchinamella sediminis]RLQ22376.1 wax ester/triacylglycerol synthase family O-acyltransferase [Seongchinamella sediminis]